MFLKYGLSIFLLLQYTLSVDVDLAPAAASIEPCMAGDEECLCVSGAHGPGPLRLEPPGSRTGLASDLDK